MEYSNSYYPESSAAAAASHSDEEVMLAATHPKKRAGRKKFKETRHPVYRGIRQRNSNKWVCELREPSNQKRVWLGTYPTAEMAARAHDVAALALKGNAACLNFADSPWRVPVPASKDPKDLRKAAAEAAEAFRPTGEQAVYDQVEARDEEERERVDNEGGVAAYPDMYDVVEYEDLNMAAEGAMMSPPPSLGWRFSNWDDVESNADLDLWNF